MKAARLVVGGLACNLVVACSINWTLISPPEKDTEIGITADGDASTELADASRDSQSTTEPDDDPEDAGDGGIVCSPSAPCPGAMVCNYGDHSCGGGKPGTCVEQVSCNGAPAETACGCDGKIYASRCAAISAGTDTSKIAACSTPANTFRCGDLYCGPGDACGIRKDDTYFCRPLNGCTLGCACLDVLLGCLIGGQCGVEDGHLVVKCN